jgi:SagB-type dehydrogenase family enzyme
MNNKEISLSKIFHENTKDFIPSPEIDITEWPPEWKEISYKSYPRFKQIGLSRTRNVIQCSLPLYEVLNRRRSQRDFVGKSVTLREVATVLLCSAGITHSFEGKDQLELRAYPSAGARYPLEVYVISFNVKRLKNGVYHFNVKSQSLEQTKANNNAKDFSTYLNNQEWTRNAAFICAISAVFERTETKYGERGYRYVLFEAGHLMQNIYLISTALGLECCSIGGFSDNQLNDLLGLDGNVESTLYIAAIGR